MNQSLPPIPQSQIAPASILVGPRAMVASLVASTGARHLITCMMDGAPPTPEGIAPGQHLTLAMHDIEGPFVGFTPPAPEHANLLLAYLAGWDRTAPLLIHCHAGISRSTAAAFISLCALNPDVDEAKIAIAVRRASPKAQPNRLFVAHADRILRREGSMMRAIEEIGLGDTSGLNTPFILPAILT